MPRGHERAEPHRRVCGLHRSRTNDLRALSENSNGLGPAIEDVVGRAIRTRRSARSAACPTRGGTMSDTGEEQDDEVEETPGVEEWIADESRAEELDDGTASEE